MGSDCISFWSLLIFLLYYFACLLQVLTWNRHEHLQTQMNEIDSSIQKFSIYDVSWIGCWMKICCNSFLYNRYKHENVYGRVDRTIILCRGVLLLLAGACCACSRCGTWCCVYFLSLKHHIFLFLCHNSWETARHDCSIVILAVKTQWV